QELQLAPRRLLPLLSHVLKDHVPRRILRSQRRQLHLLVLGDRRRREKAEDDELPRPGLHFFFSSAEFSRNSSEIFDSRKIALRRARMFTSRLEGTSSGLTDLAASHSERNSTRFCSWTETVSAS